jgi:hypothetical protein
MHCAVLYCTLLYCAPTLQVAHFAPYLMDLQQQDSQEFLRFLLDGMSEDLCRKHSESDPSCPVPPAGSSSTPSNPSAAAAAAAASQQSKKGVVLPLISSAENSPLHHSGSAANILMSRTAPLDARLLGDLDLGGLVLTSASASNSPVPSRQGQGEGGLHGGGGVGGDVFPSGISAAQRLRDETRLMRGAGAGAGAGTEDITPQQQKQQQQQLAASAAVFTNSNNNNNNNINRATHKGDDLSATFGAGAGGGAGGGTNGSTPSSRRGSGGGGGAGGSRSQRLREDILAARGSVGAVGVGVGGGGGGDSPSSTSASPSYSPVHSLSNIHIAGGTPGGTPGGGGGGGDGGVSGKRGVSVDKFARCNADAAVDLLEEGEEEEGQGQGSHGGAVKGEGLSTPPQNGSGYGEYTSPDERRFRRLMGKAVPATPATPATPAGGATPGGASRNTSTSTSLTTVPATAAAGQQQAQEQRWEKAMREASLSWSRYLKLNDSYITDLFAGQLQSTIECLTCHTRYRAYTYTYTYTYT